MFNFQDIPNDVDEVSSPKNSESNPLTIFQYFAHDNPEYIIVLAHASWCGYCKRMYPEWNNACDYMKGKLHMISISNDIINILDSETGGNLGNLPSNWSIQGFPTVFAVKNGSVTDTLTGGPDALRQWIDRFVSVPTPKSAPLDITNGRKRTRVKRTNGRKQTRVKRTNGRKRTRVKRTRGKRTNGRKQTRVKRTRGKRTNGRK